MSLTDVVISFLVAEELPGDVLAELLTKLAPNRDGITGCSRFAARTTQHPGPSCFLQYAL